MRLKLYKGNVTRRRPQVAAARSTRLAARHLRGRRSVYDQRDAEGFIKLNALRLRLLKRGPLKSAAKRIDGGVAVERSS